MFCGATGRANPLPENHVWASCEYDGFTQYCVKNTETEKFYATCVFYSEDSNAACPEGAQCGRAGSTAGYPGNQGTRLKEAQKRNDFRHYYCESTRDKCYHMGPEVESWDWWKDEFKAKTADIYFDEATAEAASWNLCSGRGEYKDEFYYVDRDEIKRTCVGAGTYVYKEDEDKWDFEEAMCPNDRTYMCGGIAGNGVSVWGWPGQQLRAVATALEAGFTGMTDFYHPQCSGLRYP